MKHLCPMIFVMLLLLTACQKNTTYIVKTPPPTYPEKWGMIGKVGADSFIASSLNASLIYDTVGLTYELNINGWQAGTDETVYLHYQFFTFKPAKQTINKAEVMPWNSFAYYKKGKSENKFGTGYIHIASIEDTLIKGMFSFVTTDTVVIQCGFAVKPLLSYK